MRGRREGRRGRKRVRGTRFLGLGFQSNTAAENHCPATSSMS